MNLLSKGSQIIFTILFALSISLRGIQLAVAQDGSGNVHLLTGLY